MSNWSKIVDTPLWLQARYAYWDNTYEFPIKYHNWSHIQSMYRYLNQTNEPYNEALDWAVLFHDIVYDDKPNKEQRSIEKFRSMVKEHEGCNLDAYGMTRVERMILATVGHRVDHPDVSAIIRADLHGLTNTLTAFKNFGSIMEESMGLYNITETEFAENSIKFMSGLRERVNHNILTDPKHNHFYYYVANVGIDLTNNIAKTIISSAKILD
jgi:predicted metal-dependent HD superfamily phosphohydrolase